MAMSMREQYEKEIVVRNPANGDGSCGLPSLPCEPVPRLLSFSLLCLGAIPHTLIVMAINVAIDLCARRRPRRVRLW
jgi:hypothetical protein